MTGSGKGGHEIRDESGDPGLPWSMNLNVRAARAGRSALLLLTLIPLVSCGGGPASGGLSVAAARPATEAEWRALATPRPEPRPGAPRVSVGTVDLVGPYPWPYAGTVNPGLGVAELAVAALLERRDVRFVERRRFAAAAQAERDGDPPPRGRPPVGVSTGAEFMATGVYAALPTGEATLEVRVTRVETGELAGATRVSVGPAPDADPLTIGRAMVDGVLEVLDQLDLISMPPAGPSEANVGASDRVASDAVHNFLRGLAYEDAWRWEDARRAYQAALGGGNFPEAAAALARTARLRMGGTLAES